MFLVKKTNPRFRHRRKEMVNNSTNINGAIVVVNYLCNQCVKNRNQVSVTERKWWSTKLSISMWPSSSWSYGSWIYNYLYNQCPIKNKNQVIITERKWWSTILPMSMGLSWSWSYGSWIYNYLCNQCLSPLKLWVWTPYSIQHNVIKLISDLWRVGGYSRFPPPINWPLTFNHWTQKRPWHMTIEIEVLAWDRHKNGAGLNG